MLQLYQDKSGKGGILAFEIFADAINIVFKPTDNGDYKVYCYDYNDPGKKHVEAMKRAALGGEGLTTYKNQFANGDRPSKKLTKRQYKQLVQLLEAK